MLDVVRLTELTEALEKLVLEQNIEEIQRLCAQNNDFIFSLKPLINDSASNQKIKLTISFLKKKKFVSLFFNNHMFSTAK